MATLRAWFIEEIDLGNGDIGHRQTVVFFDSVTGNWIRPDDRLKDAAAISLWDQIMSALENVPTYGDVRYAINPVSLMDYCNDESIGRDHRKRGTGNDHSIP
jgi:hypothetical protein